MRQLKKKPNILYYIFFTLQFSNTFSDLFALHEGDVETQFTITCTVNEDNKTASWSEPAVCRSRYTLNIISRNITWSKVVLLLNIYLCDFKQLFKTFFLNEDLTSQCSEGGIKLRQTVPLAKILINLLFSKTFSELYRTLAVIK